MMNMACPVCNNPIFRTREGNTFCPTCNRNVIVINSTHNQDNVIRKNKSHYEEQEKGHHQDKRVELINSLEEVIFEKVDIITNKLKNETHLQLIKTYTKILIDCLDILNKIQFKR